MRVEKNKVIEFALRKIITEQFAVIEDAYKEQDELQLSLTFKFGASPTERTVTVISAFKFEVDKRPFLIIEAGCLFQISPDGWDTLLQETDKKIVIPHNFIHHLTTIAVGTTRGILHSKTENTLFNRFFIPTINVTEQIKEDVEIALS